MNLWTPSLFCFACLIACTNGHGRLWDPPGRSTAWRFGFGTPANYNDNQLNCGGRSFQWDTHGGKCGLCGDPYGQWPANEAGGKYATGTIVDRLTSGSTLEVTVDITANHKGWHEFRLCKNDDPARRITQECLDENLLSEVGTGYTRLYMGGAQTGKYSWDLQLPAGLTCSQCVLQWKWHCGNSWGTDPDGTSGIGHGPQEQFYGCADIAISPSEEVASPDSGMPSEATTGTSGEDIGTEGTRWAGGNTEGTRWATGNTEGTRWAEGNTEETRWAGGNTEETRWAGGNTEGTRWAGGNTEGTRWAGGNTEETRWAGGVTQDDVIIATTDGAVEQGTEDAVTQALSSANNQGFAPVSVPAVAAADDPGFAAALLPVSTAVPSVVQAPSTSRCRPVGVQAAVPGMTKWCERNCAMNYCPASYCICDGGANSNARASVSQGAPGVNSPAPAGVNSPSAAGVNSPSAGTLRCRPVGIWAAAPNMEQWCNTNCNHVPKYCPRSHCKCS